MEDEMYKFMREQFEKKKALDAVKAEMQEMINDQKNNIPNFTEKHGNASRKWALLRWKKRCIEKGVPYDEKGRQQNSN